MTMIAFTLNYNVPFVVGDILFTSQGRKESIDLPTQAFDLKERLESTAAIPSSLRQKIYIMKPNLCVALAGDLIAMRGFLEELRMRCKYYRDWEIDKDILMQFLNDLNLKNSFKNSAFCFMLLQGQKDSFQDIEIGHPPEAWKIMENDLFEKVYVCGSGDEPYLKRMHIEAKHMSSHRKGDFYFAIQNNINLFSRLLAEEKSLSLTTQNSWGAGFETIYFDGESFTKFDNLTYVIFQGDYLNQTGDIGEICPVLVMHYKYYAETLVITSIDISGGRAEITDDDTHFFSENLTIKQFKIGTLFKDYVESSSIPTNRSFLNERVAAGFAFRTKTGVHTPAFYTEKDGAKIEFTEVENLLTISLKTQMLSDIRKLSKESFPNLKDI